MPDLRPTGTAGLPVSDIAVALGIPISTDGADDGRVMVTGVTLRGQAAQPGDLFAALPGAAAHGAGFAADAVSRGAVAVLTDPEGQAIVAAMQPALPVPVLVHENPRAVLGAVAAQVYGDPSASIAVVGITGTSGKTTTSYLVEAGLRAAGRRAGLIGTVGIRIDGVDMPSSLTTPEAPAVQALLALMVERGVDTVVMEVSSHALSLGRVDGVRYAVGGFTNLSRDHLDFHPTMADYFEAKARLFDPNSPAQAAVSVICVDDDAGRAMAARAHAPVTVSTTEPAGTAPLSEPAGTAPLSEPADWTVSDVGMRPDGAQEFTVHGPDGAAHRISIRLPGAYNIANCLVALAILDSVGVSPEQAAQGLATATVPGRLEPVDRGQPFLALVDYAHKPGALRAVLETLRERSGVHRIGVVVGAGGNRDAGKREPMGQIAADLADLVVVTDDNPRDEDPATIRAAILAGAGQSADPTVVEIGDRRAAIEHAVHWAEPGDVVLIAGKGHESGQTSRGVTVPFDDRLELAAALEALAASKGCS